MAAMEFPPVEAVLIAISGIASIVSAGIKYAEERDHVHDCQNQLRHFDDGIQTPKSEAEKNKQNIIDMWKSLSNSVKSITGT